MDAARGTEPTADDAPGYAARAYGAVGRILDTRRLTALRRLSGSTRSPLDFGSLTAFVNAYSSEAQLTSAVVVVRIGTSQGSQRVNES